MNNKELTDIVETYKELECLNPRTVRKKDDKLDQSINRQKYMFNDYSTKFSKNRKPSLPAINDYSKIYHLKYIFIYFYYYKMGLT